MYGPCSFEDPFWTTSLPQILSMLPKDLPDEFISQVYKEIPAPTVGGVSLEGQSTRGPNFKDPRVAFAFTQIGNGTVMNAIYPSKEWDKVDPIKRITSSFPPTFIVHGDKDTMVPMYLSEGLYSVLKQNGVKCGMKEVPGEEHTFAGKMTVGSPTWNIQREGFDFLESLIK
jgi:acetyl esterase/lipase